MFWYYCHMRNLLRCPSCDTPIAMIEMISPSTPPESNSDLRMAIADWLAADDWRGQMVNADLLQRYRDMTGDQETSHRRWSRTMKELGVRQIRLSGGARTWVR